MQTKIIGETLPAVICKLKKGESILTENGGMSWMDNGISMKTTTNGGIMKGIGRAFAGESLFMNVYTAEQDDVEIAFSSCFPGQILEYDLKEGESIIAQKHSFLCAEHTVDIAMQFRKKLGAGFFGGEGLFITTLEGPGTVWLQTMPVSKLAGLLYMGNAK